MNLYFNNTLYITTLLCLTSNKPCTDYHRPTSNTIITHVFAINYVLDFIHNYNTCLNITLRSAFIRWIWPRRESRLANVTKMSHDLIRWYYERILLFTIGFCYLRSIQRRTTSSNNKICGHFCSLLGGPEIFFRFLENFLVSS